MQECIKLSPGRDGLCKFSGSKASLKPQRSRQAPVPATRQQANVLQTPPPSWGRGRADGGGESSGHRLSSLLARARPLPAPGRGTGSVPAPDPSTASPHPWLLSKGCQELRSLKSAVSVGPPPGLLDMPSKRATNARFDCIGVAPSLPPALSSSRLGPDLRRGETGLPSPSHLRTALPSWTF